MATRINGYSINRGGLAAREVGAVLKAKQNEILDEDGKQLAVVLPSGVSKSIARRWAQFIVDRENSQRRAGQLARQEQPTSEPGEGR